MQEFEGESWQAGYGYTLEDETAVCFCVFNSNNGNSEWYGFKIPKSDSVSGKQQVVAESMHDTRGDSNLIKIGKQGPLATLAYNRHVNSVALGSILYCIGIDRSIGIEESIDMESIGIDNIIQMDHCIGVEEIGHIDYSIGIDGSIRIDDSIGIDRSIGIDEISHIDYSIGSDESAGIDDSIGIDLESIGMDESIDIDEIIYIDDSSGIDESQIQNLPGHYASDVYCFDINCPAQGWYQGPSMMAPRFLPDILVMDGKLYVMGGVDAINFEVPWAEVFDPITQKWEPLPDPPPTIRKSRLVYAVCHDDGESKILVGTYTYDKKDSLYEYNVANKCWRQLPGHEMSFGYSGPAVAFGNKLYWFTETGHLFAYDLLQKLLYKCHVDKRLKDIGHHFNLVHLGGDQLCLLWISGVIDPNSNSDSDYEFESDSGSARGSCFHCYQFEVSMGIKNRKECLKACKNTCQSFIIDEEVSFVDGLLLSIKAQRSTLSNYVENDRFSSGLQLANLVVNSNLLNHSWDAILATSKVNPNEQQSLPFSLKYYVYQQSNCTIIAFITSPIGTKHHLEDGKELVSSATFKDTFPLFEFLCTEGNSSFSIHRAAITCFANSYNELSELKGQLGNACPLIITGHSLGGSIASLFTLWLLENSKAVDAKRPFCITFGAPLLGDDGLQKAIVGHSTWNSCFLHVAANQDPVPRLFILPHNPPAINAPSQTNVYKPFGSYLLCSEMGSTCLEDPEAITVAMGLQNSMNQQPIEEFLIIDYGRIIEFLKSRVIFKGTSQLGELITQSHRAGISLQLEAIGVNRTQQQQQNIDVNILIIKMEDWEKACMLKKRQAVDGIRKLNHVKIRMSYLEWYKKDSNDMEIGYYDRYMNMGKSEQEVVKCKKFLTDYWKKLVEEAEILKTQKEGVSFRGNRWVFGGTNYRRMVEPLDIAEYYKESGRRDYITNGRSQHYIELEKLQADAEKPSYSSVDLKKGNVKAILTEDSCFWAYVEEALISCRLLNNGDSIEMSRENLIKFEDYVLHNLQNYSVSPEIFLPNSSFMKWWREYNRIMGTSYNSSLSEIMRTRRYHLYATGEL